MYIIISQDMIFLLHLRIIFIFVSLSLSGTYKTKIKPFTVERKKFILRRWILKIDKAGKCELLGL